MTTDEKQSIGMLREPFTAKTDYDFVEPILALVIKAGDDHDLSNSQILKVVGLAAMRRFLLERKEAALQIDADTAEVASWHCHTMDPYGIDDSMPEELEQVGRDSFVRSPGGVWVWTGDLPDEINDALSAKHLDDPMTKARPIPPTTPPEPELSFDELLESLRKGLDA